MAFLSPILVLLACVFCVGSVQVSNGTRSFIVGYNDNCFLKDGQPFRYISGTMHYYRVPRAYWKDRMIKMRAAGLNALQTYIEWNSHEPEPGVYDFSGNLDIVEYIMMAAETGLLVIVRPGPYIDSERDMGGLPYWLLRMNKSIVLRTMDQTYMFYVERYLSKLLPLLQPLMYHNGGPIISVQVTAYITGEMGTRPTMLEVHLSAGVSISQQVSPHIQCAVTESGVENEYGSYFACDRDYTARLRRVLEAALGMQTLFFTTDGDAESFIHCGQVDGAYTTVDFGSGVDVNAAFSSQRQREPKGPLVNSEYYPGWIDHWSLPHSLVSSKQVAKTLDQMLAMNASVNIYTFHGGTSFGLTSGANIDSGYYDPNPTSYDFDAPLSESGDLTNKFMILRDVIGKYLPLPSGPLPKNSTKMTFGPLHFEWVYSWLDVMYFHPTSVHFSDSPMTFEELGVDQGFVLYETTVNFLSTDPVVLSIPGLKDRGYVFVNKTFKGIISRQQQIFSIPILILPGQNLSILVENQGRVCYGTEINDFKGILENVTLGETVLKSWTMYTYSIPRYGANVTSLVNMPQTEIQKELNTTVPGVFVTYFRFPSGFEPADTFLRLDGWYKGIAALNGRVLGRYWPVVGPQATLYVPGVFFNPYPQMNVLALIELEGSPCSTDGKGCNVYFVDTPDLNSPTPAARAQIPMTKPRRGDQDSIEINAVH